MGDETDVATSPDHTYEIKSLSRSRVAGFLIMMLITAVVASVLLVSGTMFLVNTINIETLLLNTAALEAPVFASLLDSMIVWNSLLLCVCSLC